MIRPALLTLSLVILVGGIVTGCGKGKTEATESVQMSPEEVALTKNLTEALRQYYFTKRNVPTNFDEFVSVAGLKQVPQPPPGKKFAINRRQIEVVVVNQ